MTKPVPLRNYRLDAIRALAALSVLFTHTRDIFFLPYKHVTPGFLVNIVYVQHYLARGGVICFFVLSGYLVGGSVIRALESRRWSWPDFLMRRITRLQMVLIPALVLTLALDLAGEGLAWDVYADVREVLTVANFFGCLFFLQYVAPGFVQFGSNGALWSLSYEFWYYIMFPLVLLPIARPKRALLWLPILAGVLWLTFGGALFLFPCWLAGALVVLIDRKLPIRRVWIRLAMLVGSVLGFLAVTLACGAHRLPVVDADYIFAMLTVVLLWACLSMPLRSEKSFYARTAILLSEFSYTLYLTHQPILQFVKAMWLGNASWLPDFPHLCLAALVLIGVLILSWFIYLLFESRTDRLRLYLSEKLRLTATATQQ